MRPFSWCAALFLLLGGMPLAAAASVAVTVDAERTLVTLPPAPYGINVACWDAKYTYDAWRPITAIRMADTAQNTETTADPGWEPLLNTPNHPEYVSGHSAFSGAAGRILSAFFGTGEIAFEVGSDTLPEEVRKFERVDDCVRECSLSRVYGGIHFRFSCEDGVRLGQQVGDYSWEKNKGLRTASP